MLKIRRPVLRVSKFLNTTMSKTPKTSSRLLISLQTKVLAIIIYCVRCGAEWSKQLRGCIKKCEGSGRLGNRGLFAPYDAVPAFAVPPVRPFNPSQFNRYGLAVGDNRYGSGNQAIQNLDRSDGLGQRLVEEQ